MREGGDVVGNEGTHCFSMWQLNDSLSFVSVITGCVTKIVCFTLSF